MNTFLCIHRNILKCSCNFQATKYSKYSTSYCRSHLAQKYRLNNNAHSKLSGRSLLHPKYTAVISASPSNDALNVPLYNYNAMREFRLYQTLRENPSSKVEATVQTMKNKQKEKVEEIMKEAASSAAATSNNIPGDNKGLATQVTETPNAVVVKKSLKTRIWEEIVHYYHGFRLLIMDINICRQLCWRLLNGKTLSRRENKLLVRTTSDVFRLIPFSVFIIVPFMELLLPVFIKFFPGMLPSTFQTTKEREDKLKQSLTVKLEMAKFLQKTLDEMAVQHKEHKSEDAKQFAEFFQKIKDPNEYVSNEQIIKFAKRFEDEITLDSLSREQMSALCRLLELNTMGTTNFLRFHLRFKLRSLAADDRVIAREGVDALDLYELQQACKSRGMRAYGLTDERLRSQLQEWIDLSLNEKVPPTLLLLSRALLISDDTTTTDKLKEIIRALPDSVAAQTKAAIGELEGKIDNKTKIEIIKEEERKIKEEREEEREEEKAKAEILLDKAPTIESSETPILVDPIVQVNAAPSQAKDTPAVDEKNITSKDVELLSEALKTLSSDKKKMMVEKETIKDLKEELQDYKEDVEELREVRNVVKEEVRESVAAKRLFKKVNSMIGQLDKVLDDLEKKHEKIRGIVGELTPEQTELKRKEEELVRVDELVNTIKKLKQTSDESRLKYIEGVLSKIDADKDGVITVDEVLKVVEAIGRENVNLDEKQMEELLTLLSKENVIEAEERTEKALAKSIKVAKQLEDSKKAAEADELKDIAPELKDKAVDMNLNDKNSILTQESKCPTEAAEKQKEKILPKADISSAMPSAIPPPTTSPLQDKPKDKML